MKTRKTAKQFDNLTVTIMEVLVYKTNINHRHDIDQVRPYFNNQSEILKWNVDTEDKDTVLRVEVQKDISGTIESLIRKAGYQCIEFE